MLSKIAQANLVFSSYQGHAAGSSVIVPCLRNEDNLDIRVFGHVFHNKWALSSVIPEDPITTISSPKPLSTIPASLTITIHEYMRNS